MPVRNSLLAALVALVSSCLGGPAAWAQAGPATPGPQYQGAPFGNLGPFAAAAGGTMTSVTAGPGPCLTASPNPILVVGTITLQVPLSVPCGGTGDTTLTIHSVLLGEGVSPVAFAAPSTAGFILTSNGASADPSFQPVPAGGSVTSVSATTTPCLTTSPAPITSAGTVILQNPLSVPCGGTGDSTLTAHAVLLGEATSPVAFATVGTAARFLRDNGSGVDPSFTAITDNDLPIIGANTYLGNPTASPSTPTDTVIPSCSTAGSVLQYTSNTGFTCVKGALRIAFTWNGVPPSYTNCQTPTDACVNVTVVDAATCPAGFTGSAGNAQEAATGTAVATVLQNGTSRGTFTWAASGTQPTPASGAGMTIAAGDQITLALPTTADATLGDISVTIFCSRT